MANFPANTGYAWDFIESLYAGVANELSRAGVRTWVAYPEMRAMPRTLTGSSASAVQLEVDLSVRGLRSVRALAAFIRENGVGTVYFADRPAWSPFYLFLRAAGVERIVVHDHSSGSRTVPRGLKRMLKWLRARTPGMLADVIVVVSDFVARRTLAVELLPPGRVHRVWNTVPIPEYRDDAGERLRDALGLPSGRMIVGCACRATAAKGVQHLLRAFDQIAWTTNHQRPLLVYFGDGPALAELEQLRAQLRHREDVYFGGYRPDARELLSGADLCVVPSIWDEAFGLAVLEPMAYGIPVVASRVGAIPEIVVHGKTGLLVTPGDEKGLAEAMQTLLLDRPQRRRMGENSARRARRHFARSRQIRELLPLIAPGAL